MHSTALTVFPGCPFEAALIRCKSPKDSSLVLEWQLPDLSVPCPSIFKSGDAQGSVFKGLSWQEEHCVPGFYNLVLDQGIKDRYLRVH